METRDDLQQARLFEAMKAPEFYPHSVEGIEERETHISKVFLTGSYVYKIKKPVNLGFLDFTTLVKRRRFCLQEVALNRRLTRDVYLEVVPLTRFRGRYALGGRGRTIEYAVKMRQLPEEQSMVGLLRRGEAGEGFLKELALILARFYDAASTDEHISSFGSWNTVWTNCEENFSQTENLAGAVPDARKLQIVRSATRSFLHRRRELFEHRIEQKRIRDCHGDLKAGHIYLVDGIQVIDCIEFNDRFRYGDVTADLAFLAMDLDARGYPHIGQWLLDAYVRESGDRDVFVLLDFYKCYRAMVQVKVHGFLLEASAPGTEERAALAQEVGRYLDLAYRYAVQFTRPTIWVICGLPASGKSTIAAELARTLGIAVFRSDVVRKQFFSLSPGRRQTAAFGEGIYSPGATSLIYGKLLMSAQEEIEKGSSVVLDATYGSRHHREDVSRLARDLDTNLVFVECVCPDEALKARLRARETAASVSDARLEHFDQFKAHFQPLSEVNEAQHIRVDTCLSLEENMERILSQDYVLVSRQSREIV